MSKTQITTLQWQSVAPHSELHAAAFAAPPNRSLRILPHTHADFCELMLILSGTGEHLWNGNTSVIHSGNLFFLGPRDTHAIRARAGERLHWINIAFPLSAWSDFYRFLSPDRERAEMLRGTHRHLESATLTGCIALFEKTLSAFVATGQGSRLDLARFFCEALPFLKEQQEAAAELHITELPKTLPPWMQVACTALLRNDNGEALRQGVPLLRERAGVSATHLARAFQTYLGQTPTEWVAELRLRRAALLLIATTLSIAEIAGECGFNELGYFYRRFRAFYKETPQSYRLRARQNIAPSLPMN